MTSRRTKHKSASPQWLLTALVMLFFALASVQSVSLPTEWSNNAHSTGQGTQGYDTSVSSTKYGSRIFSALQQQKTVKTRFDRTDFFPDMERNEILLPEVRLFYLLQQGKTFRLSASSVSTSHPRAPPAV